MGSHIRPGRRTETPWWQGFVSASCPESGLTGAPLCFPGEHHTFLPCLTDVFPATSAVPSLSISRVHPSGLGQCGKAHPPPCPRTCLLQDEGQDVLLRAGVPLFQTQLLPIKLEEILLLALSTPLHWRDKERK